MCLQSLLTDPPWRKPFSLPRRHFFGTYLISFSRRRATAMFDGFSVLRLPARAGGHQISSTKILDILFDYNFLNPMSSERTQLHVYMMTVGAEPHPLYKSTLCVHFGLDTPSDSFRQRISVIPLGLQGHGVAIVF
jgi:hypothetical protein